MIEHSEISFSGPTDKLYSLQYEIVTTFVLGSTQMQNVLIVVLCGRLIEVRERIGEKNEGKGEKIRCVGCINQVE